MIHRNLYSNNLKNGDLIAIKPNSSSFLDRDNIDWFEFEIFQKFPQITHSCFTSSFSKEPSGEKDPTLAATLLKILLPEEHGNTTFMRQIHGTAIQFIEDGFNETLPCDAIATNQENSVLVVLHADCQPCLLFDPCLNVIAAIHSGWRGSALNIYQQTINALTTRYGCNPCNLIACIGPSLGPQHAQFLNYKRELPSEFWPYQTENCLFNFWSISHAQLISCGLREENIEIAQMCTYEQADLFFSYRRNRTTMRNMTCICLKKGDESSLLSR